MSHALAAGAVLLWAIGAVALPIAAWLWIRAGRRRWFLIAFAAGLVAELVWLGSVVQHGLGVLLDPGRDAGLAVWADWAVGVGGLAMLVSGLTNRPLTDPDRAAEVAIGLFGTGVLLRQLAQLLA